MSSVFFRHSDFRSIFFLRFFFLYFIYDEAKARLCGPFRHAARVQLLQTNAHMPMHPSTALGARTPSARCCPRRSRSLFASRTSLSLAHAHGGSEPQIAIPALLEQGALANKPHLTRTASRSKANSAVQPAWAPKTKLANNNNKFLLQQQPSTERARAFLPTPKRPAHNRLPTSSRPPLDHLSTISRHLSI